MLFQVSRVFKCSPLVRSTAESKIFMINLVAPDRAGFHQLAPIPSYSFSQAIGDKHTAMKMDGKKMKACFFTGAKARLEIWLY